MLSAFILSALSLALSNLFQQEEADIPYAPAREILQTVDQRGLEWCLGSMVGFQLTMQCRVGPDGQGQDCEVLNPTPATRRNERVFQCMASKIRYHYEDGNPAVGELVQFRLGGKTSYSEDEYQKYRNESRNRTPKPNP